MKKIGFIGAYDKTDFILYVAKILVEMGSKVLLIDGTLTQRARYIIPVIKPSRSYVTEFEGVDIAVGFNNIDEIKEYLALPKLIELNYDFILIDMDTTRAVNNFEIETCNQVYFTTSFDMYSIKKGLESISGLQGPVNATKILFVKDILKEEDDYLNFLSLRTKIVWDEEKIYFPFESGDQSIIYTNQRVQKIKLKKLSNDYKGGLMHVAIKISEGMDENLLRKAFKKIEKGV